MSVEFDEDKIVRRDFSSAPTPKFAEWLISHGLAKDEAGANKLQVVAAIVLIIIAIYIIV